MANSPTQHVNNDKADRRGSSAAKQQNSSEGGTGNGAIGKDFESLIGSSLRAAKDRTEEGMNYVKTRGSEVLRNAEAYIKENPVQSVGIALGVGVLIGATLRSGIFRVAAVAVGEKLASGVFKTGISSMEHAGVN